MQVARDSLACFLVGQQGQPNLCEKGKTTVTEDRQQSCQERISAHMEGREEDVRRVLAASNGDTLCRHCGERITEEDTDDGETVWCHEENAELRTCSDGGNVLTGDDPIAEPTDEYNEETIYDYGLCLTRYTLLRLELSTGGPADRLDILCDSDGDVVRVTYVFQDWFDGAEESVREGSALWDLAEWHAETERECR